MALPESAGPSSERFETELNTRSITRQLDGLESKTSQEKVQIMESIATEIGATFMGIQQHIDAGTLQGHETDAIETVTDIINGTDGNRRRMLERQVRRLRKERNWTLRRHLGRPNPGVLSDVLPRLEEENRRLQEENEWWRSRTEGLRLERDSLLNRLQAKEPDIAPPTEAEEDGEPEERTQAETEG